MSHLKLDKTNNKLDVSFLLDNYEYISYLERCIKNGTKGRIELSLYNGKLVNIAGKFQKYKGVDIWNHKNIRL